MWWHFCSGGHPACRGTGRPARWAKVAQNRPRTLRQRTFVRATAARSASSPFKKIGERARPGRGGGRPRPPLRAAQREPGGTSSCINLRSAVLTWLARQRPGAVRPVLWCFGPRPANPNGVVPFLMPTTRVSCLFGVRGHDRAFGRDNMSSRPKAATCRRTPKPGLALTRCCTRRKSNPA